MIDPHTGLEIPPEIAAATLEIEKQARDVMVTAACLEGVRNNTERLQQQYKALVVDAPPAQPIPFDDLERRIKLLRENGVRSYRDPYMQVLIDTYKRQPDPAPILDTVPT